MIPNDGPDRPFPWRDNDEILAESIETLCTVEMTAIGPGRGIVRPFLAAATAEAGGSPTLVAARALTEAIAAGRCVVLATGIVVPGYLPMGESDGPIGAAALAWTLREALGASPVFVGEAETHAPLRAALAAFDLAAASVVDFPAGREAAAREAAALCETLRPAAIVTTEKPSLNDRGVAHTSTGLRLDGPRARVEALIDAGVTRGVLTVGIGDNGNEIGFGRIADAVARHKPYGAMCRCGCGGGIVAATKTAHLVVATVSNWGCYGLAAMIAGLVGRPDLVPPAAWIRDALDACVSAGARDGATGEAIAAVDGIPAYVEHAVARMLRVIVEMGLARRPARAF